MLKEGKEATAQEQLQSEHRGVGIRERSSSADTKVGGGAGGAPGEKQIPLQPVVEPMVRKAVPLQPMQGHGGAEVRDSPTAYGDPAPKQVVTQRRL